MGLQCRVWGLFDPKNLESKDLDPGSAFEVFFDET